MKLSEAIIKGCAVLRPTKHMYFSADQSCACALGAAMYGMTGKTANVIQPIRVIECTLKETGVDLDDVVQHPVTDSPTNLHDVIITLNDVHGWSREDIAAWLAGRGL